MLNNLDTYLATASCTELVVYASLGIITLGLGPFLPAWIGEHYLAARRASQGIS
ncbi:hypothetical protein LOK46_13635 [Methylobacterium sp. NMS14P]|uniref:hypothetical protein n=1 Tax=Methylobacterium sp. NMS14P TaxID=2894310 RepID=UPI002358E915|nr:hypothetical protein [Methylobacterium sp. NMS14P]WCS27817.1 hypothetical protein LOK46_13635 [Methylobacterium sp. NMS14P]